MHLCCVNSSTLFKPIVLKAVFQQNLSLAVVLYEKWFGKIIIEAIKIPRDNDFAPLMFPYLTSVRIGQQVLHKNAASLDFPI